MGVEKKPTKQTKNPKESSEKKKEKKKKMNKKKDKAVDNLSVVRQRVLWLATVLCEVVLVFTCKFYHADWEWMCEWMSLRCHSWAQTLDHGERGLGPDLQCPFGELSVSLFVNLGVCMGGWEWMCEWMSLQCHSCSQTLDRGERCLGPDLQCPR